VQAAAGSIDVSGIKSSLIATVLYAGTLWLAHALFALFAKKNPLYRRLRLFVFAFALIAVNALSFQYVSTYWLVSALTLIMFAVVVWKELNQFWEIGLVGADREVKLGIDYKAALSMCKHSFHFLGIGAAKLTQNQSDFRQAIDRCYSTEPVKLLLGRPDAEELKRFATMAGKDHEAYQKTVRESLRFIASLRSEEKNIEVRFYNQFPAFRLMIVDDSVCLMSYYIMGKGDGSGLPQLHIIRQRGSQDTESLYFGFKEYFQKMWDASTDWDFKEFL
jgi:hypothetical protein